MQLLKYSGREPGHFPTEKMIDPVFSMRKKIMTVAMATAMVASMATASVCPSAVIQFNNY